MVREVITHHYQHIFGVLVLSGYVSDVIVQSHALGRRIVHRRSLVVEDGRVFIRPLIILETLGRGVISGQRVHEQLLFFAEVAQQWLPEERHVTLLDQLVAHALINTTNDHCLEAKIVEESCVGLGVAEGVYLPADARSHAELRLEESVTLLHVENNIFKVDACLVSGRPASHGDLKLAILNELLD